MEEIGSVREGCHPSILRRGGKIGDVNGSTVRSFLCCYYTFDIQKFYRRRVEYGLSRLFERASVNDIQAGNSACWSERVVIAGTSFDRNPKL